MSSELLPKISVITPTRNARALLENLLQSVARQDYPRDRIELLISDARSTDGTRELAAKFGATVMDDNGSDMEEAKRIALARATGDYVLFADADNEFTHADFFRLAVAGLEKNPQALGVESYYLASPKMSSFCAYITATLHISDPIAWLMTVRPRLVATDGEVERWTLPEGTFAYPLGANGFLFRRADLEAAKAREQFQDTHVAMHLMRAGKREWLRLRGRGVHHYYVQDLLPGFLHKRRRAIAHYFNVQKKTGANWSREKPRVPAWLACLYAVTVIGPLYHTVTGLARTGDRRWLWHTPACFVSALGTVWGWWTFKRHSGDKQMVSKLQPKQTLKE
ncbi:MAG: glycosyltransferase family 2 protein [Verrucomicrobia bacterium]|nr:glycosyltransferase family 2 protein [Verrucomicrobiota bacterium]